MAVKPGAEQAQILPENHTCQRDRKKVLLAKHFSLDFMAECKGDNITTDAATGMKIRTKSGIHTI
jgi:hypothetical protein